MWPSILTFLGEELTWRELVGDGLRSLILSGLLQIMLRVFYGSLHGKWQKIAFWICTPLIFLIIFSAFTRQEPSQKPFVIPPAQVVVQPSPTMASNLKGNIDLVSFGTPTDTPQDTAIYLIVSIRNLGTPSIVEGWKLSIFPPSSMPLFPDLTHIGPEQTITVKPVNPADPQVTLFGEDALHEKTVRMPIPTGGMQRGLLYYRLSRMPLDRFGTLGTRFVLTYTDVIGKEFNTEYTIDGPPQPIKYYPGMKMGVSKDEKRRIED